MARALVSAVLLTVILLLASRRIGPLPALGPFLNPVTGVWSAAADVDDEPEGPVHIPGLEAPVEVIYDSRRVPHIFARTSEDAARALGYVVARDRLLQLETRWRAAAGRMSELVGSDALAFDRRVRRLGLAWSAERDFAALDPTSPVVRELVAYADGVNAFIEGLAPSDFPIEYRLLGARPSEWEPVYSIYVLKLMGWDLTYPVTTDLARLRLRAKVGKPAADALAPVVSPIQEPIQPNGEPGPRFDFAPLPPPGEPDSVAATWVEALTMAFGLEDGLTIEGDEKEMLGSNNWAVSPGRTAAGHALLAGDPHLALTLPSIWYEAHLVVPGELDVYGATIPSEPFVVIGFNRDVAWSLTNTGADVIDYYEERLDDPERPSRYLLDGEWRSLERRIENYHEHDGGLLDTDTLYATHRGPVLGYDRRHLSMRWTVLEGARAYEALRGIARASNVDEALATTATFSAPAQNIVLADRGGRIAIRSTGDFPLHPDGSGLRVRDGTTVASDWLGFWPLEGYPASIDPTQGYLASANQQPIDPRVDSTYLGADWPAPWRAIRINTLLRGDSSVTPEAMRLYQTDPGNARAELFLRFFIAAGSSERLEEDLPAAREAAVLLMDWDARYTRDNERAVLFEYAMDELTDRVWDELLDSVGSEPAGSRREPRRVYTPSSTVLAQLLSYPESEWWDDARTEDRLEDRDAILAASLAAALDRTRREHGDPDGGGWRWGTIRHANIYHVLGLPAFSALGLPMRGGPGNLNPSSGRGRHGASWRMVVELGPEVRAWTVFPGGQSGHPLSRFYDDRIPAWVAGELEAVILPASAAAMDPRQISGVLTLSPGRRR